MYRTKKGLLMRLACLLTALALTAGAKDFDGKRALEYTRKAVEFGPRPPGSGWNDRVLRRKTWTCA